MIKLTDIIEIKEHVPHISVKGLTRVKPMPHDILEIEGQLYRIAYFETVGNNFEFLAIRKNEPVSDIASDKLFKTEN